MKFKKILLLFLTIATTMTLGAQVQANSLSDYSSDVRIISPEFPNAYMENKVIITDGTPQNKLFMSSSIQEYPINETVAVVQSTVYVEEKYSKLGDTIVCTDSKLLSKNEVDKIGKENFTTLNKNTFNTMLSSGYWPADSEIRGKLTLTFTIRSDEPYDSRKSYNLIGDAQWQNSLFLSDQENSPAVGDDFIGFAWGGGYDSYLDNIHGNYSNGSSVTYYPSAISANAAFVWAFKEIIIRDLNLPPSIATTTNASIKIRKNTLTGNGNTTSLMFKYIHTYQTSSGSISVSATPSGLGGGFSLRQVEKQWSLVCNISGIRY